MAMTTTMSVIKLIPRYVRKVAGWLTVWLVAIDVIHYKVNNNIARQHLVSQPAAAATAPTVVDENKIF